MSNNTPDYVDNLVFAPTSADDLNEQKRQSEVLISALEKCEKLEKQLKIAIEGLEKYANEGNWESTMYGAKDCFFIPNGERRIDDFLLAQEVLKELDK
jgi:hypothetical protein